MKEEGVLCGVGVGIGDPEEMTLKAVRFIKEADVICIPNKSKDNCRAYSIVKEAVPEVESKECICLDFKMTPKVDNHKELYDVIKTQIQSGKKVAFLTIGDPMVYSTFSYMMSMALEDGIKVEVASGITSFCEVAARLNVSLCEGDEQLHILTGQVDEKLRILTDQGDEQLHILTGQEDIRTGLELPGTKVIMKSGKNISEIKKVLKEKEESGTVKVYAISNCGMDNEEIYYDAKSIPDDARYMMTIIVKEV